MQRRENVAVTKAHENSYVMKVLKIQDHGLNKYKFIIEVVFRE